MKSFAVIVRGQLSGFEGRDTRAREINEPDLYYYVRRHQPVYPSSFSDFAAHRYANVLLRARLTVVIVTALEYRALCSSFQRKICQLLAYCKIQLDNSDRQGCLREFDLSFHVTSRRIFFFFFFFIIFMQKSKKLQFDDLGNVSLKELVISPSLINCSESLPSAFLSKRLNRSKVGCGIIAN